MKEGQASQAHEAVFIGDVRLPEFRKLLVANGIEVSGRLSLVYLLRYLPDCPTRFNFFLTLLCPFSLLRPTSPVGSLSVMVV